MGSFLRSQQCRPRVVIEVPRAIAEDAEFAIRVTNEAYEEMSVAIKQDDKRVVTVTREGAVVKHDGATPKVMGTEYSGREIRLKIDVREREYGQFCVELFVDEKSRYRGWYTDKTLESVDA